MRIGLGVLSLTGLKRYGYMRLNNLASTPKSSWNAMTLVKAMVRTCNEGILLQSGWKLINDGGMKVWKSKYNAWPRLINTQIRIQKGNRLTKIPKNHWPQDSDTKLPSGMEFIQTIPSQTSKLRTPCTAKVIMSINVLSITEQAAQGAQLQSTDTGGMGSLQAVDWHVTTRDMIPGWHCW